MKTGLKSLKSFSNFQAISDIYDVGLNDDNLSLIYQANNDIRMAVNTPDGLSERQSLQDVVLQGDTWGSILASVQVDSIGKEVVNSGYGYKYMDKLPVSLLGLVDDMIGVSDAGFKAQQLNAMLNVKTTEKRLQFGVNKCKWMLVGKDLAGVISNPLTVDKWTVSHVENETTGESNLMETYDGQVEIEQTEKQRYLGFILSSKSDNMANISEIKKKSIWIIRKIFTRLESLHLKKYFFESGIILLNVMLRSSILYASETYYNLKEIEIRNLERIEEGFLRRMFQTSSGCPTAQLYLESGHVPARYAIKQTRLLFLKTILEENHESQIYKLLNLQFENPTRGDWASTCLEDLKDLKISMSLQDIKTITKKQFTMKLKISIQKRAYEYLINKRGSKGQEINYSELKMAEYLLPGYENISIDEQRSIFAIRNHMIDMPSNFPSGKEIEFCICEQEMNMKHLYICKYWCTDEDNDKSPFEMIFEENISEQRKVNKKFLINHQRRELMTKESQSNAILSVDPLSCIVMDNK